MESFIILDLYWKQGHSFFIWDGYDLNTDDIPCVSPQEDKWTSILGNSFFEACYYLFICVLVLFLSFPPVQTILGRNKQEVLITLGSKGSTSFHFPRVVFALFLISFLFFAFWCQGELWKRRWESSKRRPLGSCYTHPSSLTSTFHSSSDMGLEILFQC